MHGSPVGDVANTCLWIHSALMFHKGKKGWITSQLGSGLEKVYLAAYNHAAVGKLNHLEEWIAIQAGCRLTDENAQEAEYLQAIIRKVC
jgi:hypothetical protein